MRMWAKCPSLCERAMNNPGVVAFIDHAPHFEQGETNTGCHIMPGSSTHWNDVYATKAEHAVSWFEESPARLARHDRADGRGQGRIRSSISAAGLSRLADALLAEGYADVSVLDISREAINRLIARNGGDARLTGIVSDNHHLRASATLCALARPGGAAFPDGGIRPGGLSGIADGGPRSRAVMSSSRPSRRMARKSAAACRCVATVSMISIRSLARNSSA